MRKWFRPRRYEPRDALTWLQRWLKDGAVICFFVRNKLSDSLGEFHSSIFPPQNHFNRGLFTNCSTPPPLLLTCAVAPRSLNGHMHMKDLVEHRYILSILGKLWELVSHALLLQKLERQSFRRIQAKRDRLPFSSYAPDTVPTMC